jgi:hypothetical protein
MHLIDELLQTCRTGNELQDAPHSSDDDEAPTPGLKRFKRDMGELHFSSEFLTNILFECNRHISITTSVGDLSM